MPAAVLVFLAAVCFGLIAVEVFPDAALALFVLGSAFTVAALIAALRGLTAR